jgi:hypothetical protein
MWVLVVVLVNGSYGNPVVTIPGFKTEDECQIAANYAIKKSGGDTRVRATMCLRGPQS